MLTFAQLPLLAPLQRTLHELGFTAPTAVQRLAIPPLLDGRDVQVVAPTGTGKTAAFLLPLLQRLAAGASDGPRGLIVAPSRELAQQLGAEVDALGAGLGLRHGVLVGGVRAGPQVAAVAAGLDVVVATPGRLLDLHRRHHIALDAVEVLVLDEADQLLDLGFWPDLQRLCALLPGLEQRALLSATMPEAVASLAAALLVDPVHITAAEPAPPLARIQQRVCYVRKADKHRLLAHILGDTEAERVLVFTRTRSGADRAVALLASRGLVALALHGDKSQAARQAALEAFRAGEVGVLVATDVASRGLHVAGVDLVVSFDLPSEPETYVHRIGRTGRMGAAGQAISLCDLGEHSYLHAIEALCGRPLEPVLAHPFHDHALLPSLPSARHSAKKGRRRSRGRSRR